MKKKDLEIGVLVLVVIILATAIFLFNDDKLVDFNIEGNEGSINYDSDNPLVAMKIKDYGTIIIELYQDIAPNTVNNFISLVKKGYYDNNCFHRLVKDFVLQGGDPNGDGTGGPGYAIKGEFINNGFSNKLKHERYVVSMARKSAYNTAGGQFFIVLGNGESLDKKYASFGKVVIGTNIIDKIENQGIISDIDTGKLSSNITIIKTIVDTKNKSYDEPVTNTQ